MRTIQEIKDAPLIELSKPKELKHGMKLYRIKSEGPFTFKLTAKIPFAPSCFKGTGEEERQGIVLSISEDVSEKIQSFSKSFEAQLLTNHPDVEGKWNSSIKAATDKYPANLKAKINLRGLKPCLFYNMECHVEETPEQWRGLEVTAVIRLGGVYVQSRGAGMILDVTHLQFDPAQILAQNPFA